MARVKLIPQISEVFHENSGGRLWGIRHWCEHAHVGGGPATQRLQCPASELGPSPSYYPGQLTLVFLSQRDN